MGTYKGMGRAIHRQLQLAGSGRGRKGPPFELLQEYLNQKKAAKDASSSKSSSKPSGLYNTTNVSPEMVNKYKRIQESKKYASKLVNDYLDEAKGTKATKPAPKTDVKATEGTPSINSTKPASETSEGYNVKYTQNSGNKNTNSIFNTSTNNDSRYTYSGSKDYKNTRYEQPEQTEYSKYKYSKPHHADRSKGATESYEKFKANEAARKPREVPSAGNTKPTTPNNPAPTKVETTSAKAPTPTLTESPTRAPTRTPVRAPRVPGGTAGLGIVSAINANDAIKEAFETGSVAPIGKYALNLATGGTSGAIEQAYNDGAFESAPNASPLGAAWAVTKALVNPTNYWNLIRDAGIATGNSAVDIYNNFADYAWRDNNVPPPPTTTTTPAPIASEDDNWVIPELPDELPNDSEGDWVIPDHNFDTSPENYYNLANSGVLGNGKDRLKNWIELGGNEKSYQAGQKYLNDMFAKSYARNKVNEKVNASAPVVAPRPTPQEVMARKAQQDEMLRQSMLKTAQNPNSSVRRNMPSYFNSSTTLQNYYLNNPDLWGKN